MKKQAKSRQEVANEYGISAKTMARWLKKEGLEISKGLLTPKEQAIIYAAFGLPLQKV
jgi:transposase